MAVELDYILQKLKNIYGFRKRRKHIFDVDIEEESPKYINDFRQYCQGAIDQFTTEEELEKTFFEFCNEQLKIIDEEAPMYSPFVKKVAQYCLGKVENFNYNLYTIWFDRYINEADFTVPNDNDLKQSVDELLRLIQTNIINCYLIVPLIFSETDKNYKLTDNCFIINPYPSNTSYLFSRKDKKTNSALVNSIFKKFNICDNVLRQKIKKQFDDFKYYSKNFTDHPLLLIRRDEIPSNIDDYAYYLSTYTQNCISIVVRYYNPEEVAGLICENYKDVNHMLLFYANQDYKTKQFCYPQKHFPYNLNCFASSKAKKSFLALVGLYEDVNELASVFRHSLRFFCWQKDKGTECSEHLSIRILMIFSAIESLLLAFSTSGGKKFKIASIMIGLHKGNKYTDDEIHNAVINLYNDRSQYVHASKDNTVKYVQTMRKEGDIIEDDFSFKIVQQVFIDIIINFPVEYNSLKNRFSEKELLLEWSKYCGSMSRQP